MLLSCACVKTLSRRLAYVSVVRPLHNFSILRTQPYPLLPTTSTVRFFSNERDTSAINEASASLKKKAAKKEKKDRLANPTPPTPLNQDHLNSFLHRMSEVLSADEIEQVATKVEAYQKLSRRTPNKDARLLQHVKKILKDDRELSSTFEQVYAHVDVDVLRAYTTRVPHEAVTDIVEVIDTPKAKPSPASTETVEATVEASNAETATARKAPKRKRFYMRPLTFTVKSKSNQNASNRDPADVTPTGAAVLERYMPDKKVWITNLGNDLTDDDIKFAFRRVGTVLHIERFPDPHKDKKTVEDESDAEEELEVVSVDAAGKKRKNKRKLKLIPPIAELSAESAMLEFDTREAKEKASSSPMRLFGIDINGTMCYTEPAEYKRQLFVGNLPHNSSSSYIVQALNRIIESLQIEFEVPAKIAEFITRKGFCFLQFESHQQAAQAKELLQGATIASPSSNQSRPIKVSWSLGRVRFAGGQDIES